MQRTFNPSVQGSTPWRPTSLACVKTLAWLLDEALDCLPAYEDGQWYRYGDWGCRLRLYRIWEPSLSASSSAG